jgi:hypothetical protein
MCFVGSVARFGRHGDGSEQAGLTGTKDSIVRKTAEDASVSNLRNVLIVKRPLEAAS